MTTKDIEEIVVQYAQSLQDMYFLAGAKVSKESWENTKDIVRNALTTLTHHHEAEVERAREEKQVSTTKEELQEHLQRIGWDFSGRYPNEWIKDHNGERTNYRVCGDCIQVKGVSDNTDVCFYFKGAETVMVDEDAVALGTQQCFILFMNHDLKKALTPTKTDKQTEVCNDDCRYTDGICDRHGKG